MSYICRVRMSLFVIVNQGGYAMKEEKREARRDGEQKKRSGRGHDNAVLSYRGRCRLIADLSAGMSVAAAARKYNTTPATVRKWRNRYEAEGFAGLRDRPCGPRVSPFGPTAKQLSAAIAMRRARVHPARIGAMLGKGRSTICRWLKDAGLGKIARLSDPPPDAPPMKRFKRYERKTPGELVHLDMKTLPRYAAVGHRKSGRRKKVKRKAGEPKRGVDVVMCAVDDCTRWSYPQMYPDGGQAGAVSFVFAMVAHFKRIGVKVRAVMTDNGSAYRSAAFARTLRMLGVKHLLTPPYTPRINGKVERFIQTMQREWAHALTYADSAARAAFLPVWTRYYNTQRIHSAIKTPPAAKLARQRGYKSAGFHS